MARAKQKNVKLTAEVNLIDEIYLETGDFLRGLKLKEAEVDERIASLECIINDEAAKRDPNRNIFHIGGQIEFEIVSDEAKKKLHEEKEKKAELQEKITRLEDRLDTLHKVRKVLYKADDPGVQEEITIEENKIEDTGNCCSTNVVQEVQDSCLSKLIVAYDKLELSNRFLSFDPERARYEIMAASDCLKESIDFITNINSDNQK